MPGIKTAEVVTIIYTHQQLGLANMHLLNVRVSTQANRGLSTAQELNWHERVDLVTRSVHWSRAPASQWLAAASETRAVGARSVFDTSLFQRCCSRTAVRANWSSVQFRSCAVNKSSRIQAYITVATSRKRATKPRRTRWARRNDKLLDYCQNGSGAKLTTELDAGQSPTLARTDASLAAGVLKISSVDKTNKNRLPWQRPLSDRKFGLSRV